LWLFKSKEWEQKCSLSGINSITTNKKQMEYYTYAYLREDGTPYYIGKGKGNRLHQNHKRISLPPKERRLILKNNLSENDAFNHEVYMIFILGRKDLGTGILRNMTNGGEQPPSSKGKNLTEEHKRKVSEALKGNPKKYTVWNKGIPMAEETKKKLSLVKTGKRHNQESIDKIREANLGRVSPTKGLFWCNDGMTEMMCNELPNTNWRKGRLKKDKR